MTGPAEMQIAVRAGAAEPAAMELRPGQAVGPLAIGRRGTWRIVAPGVLEEHGFLYFNGADLFLQSTDPNTPLLAEGSPIPLEWTAIYAPCEIALGGARLWFGSPHGTTDAMRAPAAPRAEPPRYAAEPPGQAMAGGRPHFTPRVQGNDNEEATRVAPVEQLAAMRASRGPISAPKTAMAPTFQGGGPEPAPHVPLGTPSFGPMGFEAAPQAAMPPQVLPGPAMLPEAPPAAPPRQSWAGARWREASGPKKALMVLMAPLIWAVWVIFTDKPPPPSPPKPAASASARPSATPSAGAAAADTQAPAVQPPPVSPATTGSASARSAAATSPATTGPKTPQREAADAVAAGAYDRAATLYEELARSHPEVPAYGEAARIMKAKAGKR